MGETGWGVQDTTRVAVRADRGVPVGRRRSDPWWPMPGYACVCVEGEGGARSRAISWAFPPHTGLEAGHCS